MCSCTRTHSKERAAKEKTAHSKGNKDPRKLHSNHNTQNLQLKRDPGVPIPLYQQPGALGVVLVSLHHALLVEEPPDFNLDF